MAQMYDVYLNNRLTEFDIIIRNLPFRESPSVHTKMYLDAMLDYLCLQKFVVGVQDSKLSAKIDGLIEQVFNLFHNQAELGVDVDLCLVKPVDGILKSTLKTVPASISEESFNTFSDFIHLTTAPLKYELSKSIGTGNSRMTLDVKLADTLKEAFAQFGNQSTISTKCNPLSIKFSEMNNTLKLGVSPFDIFYLLAIRCETICNLNFSADCELWYSLGDIDNEIILKSYMGDVVSEKFFSFNDFVRLLSEVNTTLICFVQATADSMVLRAEIETELRRYRKVSEVDPLLIADIDLLSVEELDYVVLT